MSGLSFGEMRLEAGNLVGFLLETVHTHDGEDIGQTVGDDTEADDGREYTRGDVEVPETEETENGAAHAQDEQDPPLRESDRFVIKTLED